MAVDYTSRMAMIRPVLGITDTSEDSLLFAYLSLAGAKIMERAYPFGTTLTDVPTKYHALQAEIVIVMYNRNGAEGQSEHIESGVTRRYENADVPLSLLRGIVPQVAIPE